MELSVWREESVNSLLARQDGRRRFTVAWEKAWEEEWLFSCWRRRVDVLRHWLKKKSEGPSFFTCWEERERGTLTDFRQGRGRAWKLFQEKRGIKGINSCYHCIVSRHINVWWSTLMFTDGILCMCFPTIEALSVRWGFMNLIMVFLFWTFLTIGGEVVLLASSSCDDKDSIMMWWWHSIIYNKLLINALQKIIQVSTVMYCPLWHIQNFHF